MGELRPVTQRFIKSDIPPEIYASTVDALFEVPMALLVGSLAASVAALLTAWKAQSVVLLCFGIIIALTAVLRAIDMRAYHRVRAVTRTDPEAMKPWERRYVVGAAAYLAMLGGWSLAAFLVTDDPAVRLLSFAGTIAYLVGTSGRNFASDLLVVSQILGAGIPLSLALFVGGGFYIAIFAVLLLPLLFSLRINSNRLRRVFRDAVIATRDITSLAMRFDTALNNMPHGLCMFDAQRRLLVSNARLSELLNLPAGFELNGKSARELLLASIGTGQAPNLDVERFIANFESHLAGTNGTIFVEIRDGQTLALTTQPMANGGSVVIVEDITERRNAEARIHHLAHYDALTDLPNRTFLGDQLNRVLADMRRGGPAAVLFVDLDEFKQVNDTLGHPVGDALLRAVADRLRKLMRKSDVVARFGGDEFVVILSPVTSSGEASEVADRIVAELGQPYDVDSHHVVIGASVGIAMSPRDGVDADLLLKNADMALYHAKANGRGAWRFFEPDMDIKAHARRRLELDLLEALANNAFELYYQPLFSLRTMRVTTCEALIRWRHPERGMVPPMEFIPVAEDMGLIVDIGAWVMRNACIECTKWPGDVRVAVNMSPIQFRHSNVVEMVAAALAASRLPASRLEVEITESVLLQDVQAARTALQQIADMGVRISLDDFGTGYSGLSYLHSFPLDKVKIDRSFVKGLRAGERSQVLLRGVAQLTSDLGMSVAVEGIETEEQLAIVAAEKSIDEAQGYLFSVPIPSKQIRELLVTASPRHVNLNANTAGARKLGAA